MPCYVVALNSIILLLSFLRNRFFFELSFMVPFPDDILLLLELFVIVVLDIETFPD